MTWDYLKAQKKQLMLTTKWQEEHKANLLLQTLVCAMSKKWNALSEKLLPSHPTCLVFNATGNVDKGCQIKATEGHHGIVSRNVRFEKWVDDECNWTPACHNCNTRRVGDAFAARMHQLDYKLLTGRRKQLIAWLNAAPAKMKLDPGFRKIRERCDA